jgi:protein tyrosine/serine phosphatase
MKRSLARRLAAAIAAVATVTSLAAGGWALFLQLTGNIHTVERHELYRSAQLNGDDLAQVINKYRIKSVINLSGDNPGDAWYDDELRVSKAQGALHYDVGIGATSEPKPKVMRKLIELLRSAPRPILVHCYSGADRSGLAAALYEYLVKKESTDASAQQLSFWYGHFPWLGSRTIAMDRAFGRLVASGKYAIPSVSN